MTQPAVGQLPQRINIVNITNALPCEITTEVPTPFPPSDPERYPPPFPDIYYDKQFVRLTELNGAIPNPHGEDPLNNKRFRIIITGPVSFTLQDPITFKPIDSTNYPPYITGGQCTLIQKEFVFYPSPDQQYPN